MLKATKLFRMSFVLGSLSLLFLYYGCEANGEKSFYVQEFGAIGDGQADDGPALRKVFEMASAFDGASTIYFETEKTYYIAPYATANGRLMLKKAANVTVEGRNVTILVHTPNRALGIYRSSDIVVRDLQIDYRPLPFTQGTITYIDNNRSTLEFKPHAGYADPVVGDSTLYKDGRNEDSVAFNHQNRKFYNTHVRISGVKALDDGRFRVSYRGRRFSDVRVGDYFAMKHRWGPREGLRYAGSDCLARKDEFISTADSSIEVAHSKRVLLENIRSYAAPGMTLLGRGCHELIVRGLRIQRRGDRLVAGNSDGIHLKCNESPPIIEDCYIEGTMDDAIHIKISGDWIKEVASPRRVRIEHMDIIRDNTNLAEGKRVMVYDHENERELATAEILGYEPIDYRNGWVTLDQDIPDMSEGNSLYLEAEGVAVIKNCQFETQLQRAILTHQPTNIQGCQFRDTGQGVVMEFSKYWIIEGPPSQRLWIENCTFENLTLRAVSVFCPSHDYDQKGDPQFICTNSTFRLSEGVPAFKVVNSKGVSLSGNRFYYTGKKPNRDEYIILDNSPLRKYKNNLFIESKGVEAD